VDLGVKVIIRDMKNLVACSFSARWMRLGLDVGFERSYCWRISRRTRGTRVFWPAVVWAA